MSNWEFLNKHRVSKPTAGIRECYISTPEMGFNGMFRFTLDGRSIRIIASDGEGWRHVSVSIENDNRTPNWSQMCKIKDLFWDDEDVVIQFHPKKSEYVNNHAGCLHLWQCTDGREQPTPPSILVGLKSK